MNRRQQKAKLRRRREHSGHSPHKAAPRQRSNSWLEAAIAHVESMTKPALIDYADKMGIVVAKSWNKGMILDTIVDGLRQRTTA